jgi:hypothetical protein
LQVQLPVTPRRWPRIDDALLLFQGVALRKIFADELVSMALSTMICATWMPYQFTRHALRQRP